MYLVPGLSITLTNLFTTSYCDPIRSEVDIPLQPPGWVFSIVWPLLYVTMGITWYKANNTKTFRRLQVPIVVLCCLWLVTYSCLNFKILSALILVCTMILSWLTYRSGTYWDLPLSIWLSFASYLNVYEVSYLTSSQGHKFSSCRE